MKGAAHTRQDGPGVIARPPATASPAGCTPSGRGARCASWPTWCVSTATRRGCRVRGAAASADRGVRTCFVAGSDPGAGLDAVARPKTRATHHEPVDACRSDPPSLAGALQQSRQPSGTGRRCPGVRGRPRRRWPRHRHGHPTPGGGPFLVSSGRRADAPGRPTAARFRTLRGEHARAAECIGSARIRANFIVRSGASVSGAPCRRVPSMSPIAHAERDVRARGTARMDGAPWLALRRGRDGVAPFATPTAKPRVPRGERASRLRGGGSLHGERVGMASPASGTTIDQAAAHLRYQVVTLRRMFERDARATPDGRTVVCVDGLTARKFGGAWIPADFVVRSDASVSDAPRGMWSCMRPVAHVERKPPDRVARRSRTAPRCSRSCASLMTPCPLRVCKPPLGADSAPPADPANDAPPPDPRRAHSCSKPGDVVADLPPPTPDDHPAPNDRPRADARPCAGGAS